MKKVLPVLIPALCWALGAVAQEAPIRPRALGVSFIMNDFNTAQRIRSGSLSRVFSEKKWAKFSEMSPGLALSYFKGVRSKMDFAGNLTASYVDYPLRSTSESTHESLLLEADASAQFKMFDETYWFTPYASAGVGVSKFRGYYGAFMPLGIGFKLNLFDEAAVFLQTQYRVPVTYETANYHFMYSFGISGVIGK